MRVALAALMLLAGCQREPVESASNAGECVVAPAVQALVGREATPTLVARARQLSGARAVRRIEPDSVVTMDYRTDRLNVHVTESGTVERVSCG